MIGSAAAGAAGAGRFGGVFEELADAASDGLVDAVVSGLFEAGLHGLAVSEQGIGGGLVEEQRGIGARGVEEGGDFIQGHLEFSSSFRQSS